MFSMLVVRSSRSVLLRSLQSNFPGCQGKCPPTLSSDFATLLSPSAMGNISLYSSSQAAVKHTDHNHSNLWKAERFLSAALLGLLPAAIAFPNPALDYTLSLALTAHVHWGIEAIVVDYVRPKLVGETLSKVAIASIYGLSVMTLGGLFYFNYNDVGIGQAIRMLWKL